MSDYFLRVLSLLAASYFAMSACQRDDESIKKAQYITNGQKRYETHCKNCHGAKGEGLGKLYPPLTDEKYLRANRSSLPCILRHGLSGEIMVHGVSYDSTMPSNPELTALDIAYILTYITNSFGNRGDLISKEEVEESLQSCANEHCQPRVNRQP